MSGRPCCGREDSWRVASVFPSTQGGRQRNDGSKKNGRCSSRLLASPGGALAVEGCSPLPRVGIDSVPKSTISIRTHPWRLESVIVGNSPPCKTTHYEARYYYTPPHTRIQKRMVWSVPKKSCEGPAGQEEGHCFAVVAVGATDWGYCFLTLRHRFHHLLIHSHTRWARYTFPVAHLHRRIPFLLDG